MEIDTKGINRKECIIKRRKNRKQRAQAIGIYYERERGIEKEETVWESALRVGGSGAVWSSRETDRSALLETLLLESDLCSSMFSSRSWRRCSCICAIVRAADSSCFACCTQPPFLLFYYSTTLLYYYSNMILFQSHHLSEISILSFALSFTLTILDYA